jgi:hypothetical protein
VPEIHKTTRKLVVQIKHSYKTIGGIQITGSLYLPSSLPYVKTVFGFAGLGNINVSRGYGSL